MIIATLVLCTSLEFDSCTIYTKLFATEQDCVETNFRVMGQVKSQDPTVHFLEPSCVEVPPEQIPGALS